MEYTDAYFDEPLERRNTWSKKWDGCAANFGLESNAGIIPMWIADMDFRAPQEVVEVLRQRVECQAYGYSTEPDCFYQAIQDWVKRHYHWDVKKEWIVFTPGVIPGYNIVIQSFTQPGDGIIVQPPVYYPFMDSVRFNGRTIVYNPLQEKEGDYTMDFADLEAKVKNPRNKLLILCNPHNPVGRVWTREELETQGNLCADNGVLLISDEIHADLMMDGAEHQAVCAISEKLRQNTITHYSPSKTFNLAGLQTAYAIIPNDRLRERYLAGIKANRIFNMNWFGGPALVAAYTQCDGYVKALCRYVSANMDFMGDFLKERLPQLKMKKPEGTYMIWVDFRGTGMTAEEIESFIVQQAHIGTDMGSWFGPGGAGYLRFNLACPRSTLEKALEQLEKALQ